MNYSAPFADPRPAEQRFYERKARQIAAIANLEKQLAAWREELATEQETSSLTKRENVLFRELVATDAAFNVWSDVDGFAEIINYLCDDLGVDAEGYSLTDAGDVDPQADRVFVPWVWRAVS